MAENDALVTLYVSDPEFREVVSVGLLREIFDAITSRVEAPRRRFATSTATAQVSMHGVGLLSDPKAHRHPLRAWRRTTDTPSGSTRLGHQDRTARREQRVAPTRACHGDPAHISVWP